MRSQYPAKVLEPDSTRCAPARDSVTDPTRSRRVSAMISFLFILLFLQSAQGQNVQRNNDAVCAQPGMLAIPRW
jgi:hypothetical protein